MPSRQLPTDAAGHPKPQAQRNFTDPGSHILKRSEGWMEGYNCQAAVDGDHLVIMAIIQTRYITTGNHERQVLRKFTGYLDREVMLIQEDALHTQRPFGGNYSSSGPNIF